MADLQAQLQAILGDPAAMSQITAIAQALTGNAPTSPSPAPAPVAAPSAGDYLPVEPPAEETTPPAGPSVGQPPSAPAAPPGLGEFTQLLGSSGGVDPKLLQLALRVYGEYTAQDDEKAALLRALRPFLKPERQEKLEKAEHAARLSRSLRLALRLLREEDGNV